LFWLKEGENTMGTTADNRIVLQHGMADALICCYFLIKGELWLRAAHGWAVSIKGTDTFVDSLKVDPLDSTRVLAHRRLEWFPIKRGDQFGIRIRDLDSELARTFTGVETFPVDPRWRVRAKFEPTPERTINIVN